MRLLFILLTMISIFSCRSSKGLQTVEDVDLNKYAGVWYEIARLPNKFERGLECITATYTLKENGKIEVLNKGFLSVNKKQFKQIKGTAWVANTKYPGRLKVRFFWPFSSDYYIISLDKDYSYALVGTPPRKYLWILSKNKYPDTITYNRFLHKAKMLGFDVKKMIKVSHDCK